MQINVSDTGLSFCRSEARGWRGLRDGGAAGRGALAFFVYGFARSNRENLRRDELVAYGTLADGYLALDRKGLAAAQTAGTIVEVKCDDQAIQE